MAEGNLSDGQYFWGLEGHDRGILALYPNSRRVSKDCSRAMRLEPRDREGPSLDHLMLDKYVLCFPWDNIFKLNNFR